MAQSAATTMADPTTPPPTTNQPTPVVIDIRDVMDRTRSASIAIKQIGGNRVRAMSMPVGVISDEYLKNMHDITASSLGQLQAELKPLYRRMTAYANMRDPNDVEFHRIRTDAAAAIELADIYLSPTAFPQRTPQPECNI